jgi:RNA polymerase sigma-70 factor (ECF subfamily)
MQRHRSLTEPTPSEEESPLEQLQRIELVRQLLSLLSPLEAAVLNARYVGGLSFRQIAQIIERSPDSARQMHHRALRLLRELGLRRRE